MEDLAKLLISCNANYVSQLVCNCNELRDLSGGHNCVAMRCPSPLGAKLSGGFDPPASRQLLSIRKAPKVQELIGIAGMHSRHPCGCLLAPSIPALGLLPT